MAFDRSKFEAARKDNLKKQQEEAEKMRPSQTSTRPDYVNLKEGDNIVRIFPPHPGKSSFIYQKSVHWLPFEVKDDAGKVTVKNRPIFNSKIHSSVKDHDVIAKYVELAKKEIESVETSADKIKERIDNLYHWQNGIWPQYKWVVYATVKNSEGTNFGRLELGNGIKTDMDKLAFSEESVDDPMDTDPFTHPDTGFGLKILYRPKDENGNKVKPQDVYTVNFNTKNYVPVAMPLTDDELEKFGEMDSLEDMFVNVFTKKDLDLMLEGLQNYDKKWNIGVFSGTDFLDFIEKVYNLYPDAPTKEEAESKPKAESNVEHWKKQEQAKISAAPATKVANEEVTGLPWDAEEEGNAEPETVGTDYPSKSMTQEDMQAKLAALRAKIK